MPDPARCEEGKVGSAAGGSEVGFSAGLEGDPAEIAANAAKLKIEGIVAKRRDSTYMPGVRGHAWQKLKLDRAQDFVVGGYGPPGAKFDWLAVGYYDGDRLIYCGRILNGFNPHVRRKIMAKLSDLMSSSCPFAQSQRSRPADNVQWVKPQLVVRINFTEWTSAGILRIPKFRGIREDVDPRDVRREVQER